MKKRLLLFLVLFQAFIFTCRAQTTSFIHYGVEHGLVQSQVQTIVQDNDGNLWIGTMAGISKYNGKSFIPVNKKEGLAEDWVTTAYKDRSGNIWFGHWGGGISLYSYSSGSVRDLKMEEFTGFKTIKAIIEDPAGNIWIGTDGKGILKYDIKLKEVKAISKNEGLKSESVSSFSMDEKGNLWIGCDKGIAIVNTKNEVAGKEQFAYINEESGLLSNNIKCITQVLKNEVWVGTEDAGVIILETGEDFSVANPNIKIIQHITTQNGLESNTIQTIYRDNAQNIWIGTKSGGVTQYALSSITKGAFKTYSTKQGLNYYNVNAVLEDREGNIWIGTDLGLNQYRGDRFQIYDEADNIPDNIIWSIMEDSKGNLWLGTNRGLGKLTFTSSGHIVQNYSTDNGLSSNVILSLHEDKEGMIWIGTANGGVNRFNPTENKFKAFSTNDGLSENTVFAINSDNSGNLWFGTRGGASRFNPATSEFTNYTTESGLGGNNVYRIFKDNKENLWFAALGGYLTMYDGKGFKIFGEESGMSHKFILCINEDKDQNLWFGVYGGGIYKYNGQAFTNYSLKDGMKSESPYSVISDQENNIWIGTSSGIEKFNQQTGKFTHYGKQDGFLGVETNANAACRDAKGNIWFGTIMGAVKFNPNEDKANLVEPITRINHLKIFLKDAMFPSNSEFGYDQNHLTFQFVGVSLTSPEKVQYQYKLEGFDNDWSPATGFGEAVYSNIPPGSYTFLVKAANNDDVWNVEPAKYQFTVTPPVWKTLWFQGLVAIFAFCVIYLYVKIRTRNLQQSKKELEEKVRQRTGELANKNEELGKKNKEITDSINYAKRIQEAILPDTIKIYKALPESFIYYKPKDIVSGDFYFFTERDNKILIGSVDCTGHGVPGALMSMIGSNFLNQIVNEMGITDPAAILSQLHKKVLFALNKDIHHRESMDGMDIGLISFDAKTKEIKFAGAVRPMYYVNDDGMQEIKGNRFSIGGAKDIEEASYTNHTIIVNSRDVFYLFTDGFVDQFGGNSGKKFMSQRFKELLMEIKHLPMDKQKSELSAAFENWKGNLEQVDDILVIGVKIS